MMALNRHRLKHLAQSGQRGPRQTQRLLAQTDRLLSVILIGNNLVNTVVPVLTTTLAVSYFGASTTVLAIATGIIAFVIIVLCEIAPKVVGATYPDRIAFFASYVLVPLVWLARPLVWFVNLFTSALFSLLRIRIDRDQDTRVSAEELRTIVLESGNFIPRKHRSILLNLFDLEKVTVDDVMTPKGRIEILDLARPISEVVEQLETCYHNKLAVCESDQDGIVGVLHIRKALSLLSSQAPSHDAFRALLTPAYYIPSGTSVFQQLQYFQENHQRLGFVVNEYGEIQGLVTVEDIIEEMIGEFTTSQPGPQHAGSGWDIQGTYLADAGIALRDLNRQLSIQLPLDGPKTLNGLLLEALREIPDASVSICIAGYAMDILHIDNQTIKTVRIYRSKNHA